LASGAGERFEVRGPALVRLVAAQARLHDVVSRGRIAVEQHDRRRLTLDQRITGQLGAHQRAALEVDVDHQHVGENAHDPCGFEDGGSGCGGTLRGLWHRIGGSRRSL